MKAQVPTVAFQQHRQFQSCGTAIMKCNVKLGGTIVVEIMVSMPARQLVTTCAVNQPVI